MTEIKLHTGSLATMQRMAEKGVRGLNRKTMKWQVISKTAKYRVVETEPLHDEEYGVIRTGELYCDQDLKAIAKAKGLIY